MSSQPDITLLKDQVRAQARAEMAALAPEDHVEQSALACRALIDSELFAAARAILLYAPAADEPNLTSLASAAASEGKTIGVPAVAWNYGTLHPKIVQDLGPSLIAGKFGIRVPSPAAAPLPLDAIDLIIVPGVAFDRVGGRLGRGAGFYDRFLATPGLRAAIAAVALRPQLVDAVPVEPHDIRVGVLATPDGVFFCGRAP